MSELLKFPVVPSDGEFVPLGILVWTPKGICIVPYQQKGRHAEKTPGDGIVTEDLIEEIFNQYPTGSL